MSASAQAASGIPQISTLWNAPTLHQADPMANALGSPVGRVDWLDEAFARLRRLRSLPVGWDGYRGRPINSTVEAFSQNVLNTIAAPRVPRPSIVPLSYGGVQIEWHRKGWDVEIEVAGPNEVFAWGREKSTGKEHELPPLSTDLRSLWELVIHIRD